MWEYFHTDSYNWDSTIIMIEHAGLKSLFDGTGEYEQITFFGLTNLSILRYMMTIMMGWKRQILIIASGYGYSQGEMSGYPAKTSGTATADVK